MDEAPSAVTSETCAVISQSSTGSDSKDPSDKSAVTTQIPTEVMDEAPSAGTSGTCAVISQSSIGSDSEDPSDTPSAVTSQIPAEVMDEAPSAGTSETCAVISQSTIGSDSEDPSDKSAVTTQIPAEVMDEAPSAVTSETCAVISQSSTGSDSKNPSDKSAVTTQIPTEVMDEAPSAGTSETCAVISQSSIGSDSKDPSDKSAVTTQIPTEVMDEVPNAVSKGICGTFLNQNASGVKERPEHGKVMHHRIVKGLNIFGIRPRYVKRLCTERKKNKRALTHETCQNVKQFFERRDNAVDIPLKRKVYKSGKSRQVLRTTVKDLHKKYNLECKTPVGISSFKKLRPKHINLRQNLPWIQCMCLLCENIRLKLKAIQPQLPNTQCLRTIYTWNDSSMCPKRSEVNGILFPDKKCIIRQCVNCGLEKLQDDLMSLTASMEENITKWQVWTKKEGRILLENKATSMASLIDALFLESQNLSQHLFNAEWQQAVYRNHRNNPTTDEIVVLSDPSEKRRNQHQMQPSSVHWSYTQTSICPVVTHYRCQDKECDKVVKEVVICVSDDLKHDHVFTNLCETESVRHIQETRKLHLKKITKRSDGAPSTYKSRFAYNLISQTDHAERNIFGAQHGKNLADGEGAVAKRTLDNSVKSGEVHIDTAADAVSCLREKK